ncbi:MAG: flagellar basal body P-ring formation chaperone FlgA [Candidatus Eremiobacteraeota bacterium]|nr:flagellar basal body P-ring formation chaperone FlgA [Candidatus Eremiobacteraeota bacterium]
MLRSLAALCALAFLGSPICANANVAFAPQRVSGTRIEAVAARAVRAMPNDSMHAYIAASAVPDQLVAPGQVDLRAGAPIVTLGFINVPVTIAIDGKSQRTIFAGYRVQAYVETAVASRDVAPGSVLSAGDLAMARVPFAGRPGNGEDVLIGRKVTGAVLKGEPIAVEVTVINQIVKPGSTVLLTVRDGGASVTAACIARSGGGLGDEVSVYNPQTNRALTGIVTAPAAVELDLSEGDE